MKNMENNQVPQQPPYQAPQQPPYQAPQQPPYQQPYKAPQAPAANDSTKVFKIILYVLLALMIIASLVGFFGSFGYFVFSSIAGLGGLLTYGAALAICVVLIIRMAKNEKFGFLAVGFFLVSFLLNLITMIIVGKAAISIPALVLGVIGIAIALFAAIPMNKISDGKAYNALMNEGTTADYVLLGIYLLGKILVFIGAFKLIKAVSSLSSYL